MFLYCFKHQAVSDFHISYRNGAEWRWFHLTGFRSKWFSFYWLQSYRHHLHISAFRQKKKTQSASCPCLTLLIHLAYFRLIPRCLFVLPTGQKSRHSLIITHHRAFVQMCVRLLCFPFVSKSSSWLCAFLSSIHLPYSGSSRGLVFTVPSKLIVISGWHTWYVFGMNCGCECGLCGSPSSLQSFHSCFRNRHTEAGRDVKLNSATAAQ